MTATATNPLYTQSLSRPMTATEVEARQPQIPEWVRNVDSELDQLEKAISTLQEKASPVCRGNSPSPIGEAVKPEECLVEVADKLRHFHHRIQCYVGVIADLTNRIEV